MERPIHGIKHVTQHPTENPNENVILHLTFPFIRYYMTQGCLKSNSARMLECLRGSVFLLPGASCLHGQPFHTPQPQTQKNQAKVSHEGKHAG